MRELQKSKKVFIVDPVLVYTPEEIRAAAEIVIEALAIRYETWRQTAILKDAKHSEILPCMDDYYTGVIAYIMSMLGL